MTIAIAPGRVLVRLTIRDLWRLLRGRELRAYLNGDVVVRMGR